MRIRSIKPEFWKSDDTAALTDWNDRLIFIGLWSYVDDNGVGRDNEKLIAAELFALEDDPRETLARIRRALARISAIGMITRYEDPEGRRYIHVTKWHHQKIDKPTRSPHPLPTSGNVTFWESSANPRRILGEDSTHGSRDLGIKGSRDQGIELPSSAEPMEPEPKYPALFDEFWKHYPRKVGKDKALPCWRTAVKQRTTAAAIINAAQRMRADPNLPEEQFIPHPTTWLNRGGWNDDPYPPPVNGHANPRPSTTDQTVNDTLAMARRYAEQEAREEQTRPELGS